MTPTESVTTDSGTPGGKSYHYFQDRPKKLHYLRSWKVSTSLGEQYNIQDTRIILYISKVVAG
jgi:hypothetical protein